MVAICAQKDGNFFFIKQLATLDEAFIVALGGILSTAAKQIVIKVNFVGKNIVGEIKIGKTYGDMW